MSPPDRPPFWRTAISRVRPNEIVVRGHDLVEMIGRRSFGEVVYGKAFYVIARAPGLVAHVVEEQTRERPYRDIGWESVEYDGPEPAPPR